MWRENLGKEFGGTHEAEKMLILWPSMFISGCTPTDRCHAGDRAGE